MLRVPRHASQGKPLREGAGIVKLCKAGTHDLDIQVPLIDKGTLRCRECKNKVKRDKWAREHPPGTPRKKRTVGPRRKTQADECAAMWRLYPEPVARSNASLYEPWRDEAACAKPGVDPDLFYPPELDGHAGALQQLAAQRQLKQAREVCKECPVRLACLQDAVKHDERHGVRGGLTEFERDRARKVAGLEPRKHAVREKQPA